ncbi:hypothetical protein N0V91_006820 [Didymella pomorum]|uniref:Uncharacterized protein n=1 Tax=Didymella pomorum TaxID=749634 RepID=A0A9W9D5Z6_9PLEO|nr:hypothetical protein N0V91_006820 [Didymella pomorum]
MFNGRFLEENISTSMDYADLGTLALLVDKYNSLVNMDDRDALEKPLIAAHIFDMPDEFFKISQSMIRDSAEPLDIVAAL